MLRNGAQSSPIYQLGERLLLHAAIVALQNDFHLHQQPLVEKSCLAMRCFSFQNFVGTEEVAGKQKVEVAPLVGVDKKIWK
jgi:hypothetical protein